MSKFNFASPVNEVNTADQINPALLGSRFKVSPVHLPLLMLNIAKDFTAIESLPPESQQSGPRKA